MGLLRHLLLVGAGVVGGAILTGVAIQAADVPPGAPAVYRDKDRPLDVPGAAWFDSEWGWVVAHDHGNAERAAAEMRLAIAAFYRHFGIVPGRGAIWESPFAMLSPALTAAGAGWQAPLVTDAGAHPFGGDGAESGLRHEIGHALFVAHVFPNTRGNQYGGDAPDWLDEAAAMIAESDATTAARRAHFDAAWRAGRIPSFTAIISAEHPLARLPEAHVLVAKASASGVPVAAALDSGAIGPRGQDVADFYAAARAVTDYLIARSGDVRILAHVVRVIRDEGAVGALWAARLHAEGRLPVAPVNLDADFAAWAGAL